VIRVTAKGYAEWTRTIEVTAPHKPACGILWERLDPHMYETIPPLQQLRAMRGLPARL